jgi:hypothetical protein
MKIGHDKKTIILVLKFDAVLEGADIVAKMERAGGPVAGENAFFSWFHRFILTLNVLE